jgi:hypothetical protein
MGLILDCKCENCNYSKKDIFLGSGMTPGISYFPAFDSHSYTVTQIDTGDLVEIVDKMNLVIKTAEVNKLKDLGKVPYFVKGMFKKGIRTGKPISTSPLYLQRKKNYCPKCGKYKLTFFNVGVFD